MYRSVIKRGLLKIHLFREFRGDWHTKPPFSRNWRLPRLMTPEGTATCGSKPSKRWLMLIACSDMWEETLMIKIHMNQLDMEVSWNRGTSKSSTCGFSTIIHPFWGTSTLGNLHIYNIYIYTHIHIHIDKFIWITYTYMYIYIYIYTYTCACVFFWMCESVPTQNPYAWHLQWLQVGPQVHSQLFLRLRHAKGALFSAPFSGHGAWIFCQGFVQM